MINKPIHYHAQPKGDWDWEYSSPTNSPKQESVQSNCNNKPYHGEQVNEIDLLNDKIQQLQYNIERLSAAIVQINSSITLDDKYDNAQLQLINEALDSKADVSQLNTKVDASQLNPIAFSGQWGDLQGKPVMLTTDVVDNKINQMSTTIQTALQGKVNQEDLSGYATIQQLSDIISQLPNKADVNTLQNYVTRDTYESEISNKQDSLIAGDGINISSDNTISVTLTTNPMVTLSESQYQTLVNSNLIDNNAYYFIHEEEETTWGFGDKFPIILTDGSTPDNIGTFPINLA